MFVKQLTVFILLLVRPQIVLFCFLIVRKIPIIGYYLALRHGIILTFDY